MDLQLEIVVLYSLLRNFLHFISNVYHDFYLWIRGVIIGQDHSRIVVLTQRLRARAPSIGDLKDGRKECRHRRTCT